MARPNTNAHWRDAARNPRFFFLDAMAVLPLLLWVIHARLWTFILACCIIFFFACLERFNFTLPVFKTWLRSFLAGPYRSARPWWRE